MIVKLWTTVIWMVMTVAVITAAFLMFGHYGMISGLDFGCGQYYYTDIPDWPKYFSVKGIVENCPAWVYYLVFVLWGYLMYRLWTRFA